jgi:hypothetical protein
VIKLGSLFFAALLAASLFSAEAPVEEKPVEFKDPGAGYSIVLPKGYTRLSEDKIRENVQSNSQIVGKDVTEQILREPAVYFEAPADPAHPKLLPALLKILVTGLNESVDPALLPKYKERYENGLKKHSETIPSIDVSVVTVNGVNALKFEHELFDRLDNSRRHIIDLSIPGPGRRFELVFNYSTDQEASIREAADTIIKSFKVLDGSVATPESSNRWVRIALWTVGAGLVGILLGVLLSALTGKTQPEPSKP